MNDSDATRRRIYLDHAATGWPKKPAVGEAVKRYIDDIGASYGRGLYASAAEASALVGQIRQRLATLVGASAADCLSFHSSGTAALNAAIFGLLRPGDHVVTTVAEHNSVLRPLDHLRCHMDVDWTVVHPTATQHNGRPSADDLLSAVRDDTAMVVMTGASNVTGQTLPVQDVASSLRHHPAIVVCDAAQTFGWQPIDVGDGIDVLAAPGHKAGGGPLGTAFLYVAPELHDRIRPTIFGGTGSQSESMQMPQTMPDKLESGNLNVPALAGWLAGLPTAEEIETRQRIAGPLTRRLHEAIQSAGYHATPRGELPIVSFWHDDLGAGEIAMILAHEFGIEVRAGHHCAAKIVEAISGPAGGVVRASAGPETTDAELDALAVALREIAAG